MNDPVLSDLLARHFAGDLDEAVIEALLERCGRDPGAARILGDLTRIERSLAWIYADRGGEAFTREVLLRLRAGARKSSGFVRAVVERIGTRRLPARRLAVAAAAAAVLLLCLAAAVVWMAANGRHRVAAAVTACRGAVHVVRAVESVPARAGMDLVEGDLVRTGRDGTVEIVCAAGASVRLSADTEARFAPPGVDLGEGTIRCDVEPCGRGRHFFVRTPHAKADVLGTSFEVWASREETRLRAVSGRVRFSSGGRSVEVGPGGLSTADARGLRRWEPVADYDFTTMKSPPPTLETVFCDSRLLHTPERRVVEAPGRVRIVDGGLGFVSGHDPHGLVVLRWKGEVGDDAVVEALVAGGAPWNLGMAVAGDSFEGYRIIFSAKEGGGGISVDSIYPYPVAVFVQDHQMISFDRDRLLRVEKVGRRIRVWVDGDKRVDAELNYPLREGRVRTAALSNFGGPPVVKGLRIWKAAGR